MKLTARWTVAAAACLLLAGVAAGESDKEPKFHLGPRYQDPLNGFSLNPPADVETRRQPSASKIITWSNRDPKTRAIRWSLTVQRAIEGGEIKNIHTYATALKGKLMADDKFSVDSAKVIKVDDHSAIDLRGRTRAGLELWQRQVWVLAAPKRFLILSISGPKTARVRLDSILQAVLGTMKVHDPEKYIAERHRQMRRSQQFLGSLKYSEVVKVLQDKPQWFLMRFKDENVGWMVQTEKVVRREGTDGIEIQTWALVRFPESPVRLTRRQMWCSPDRSLERWIEIFRMPDSKPEQFRHEEGLKSGKFLLVDWTSGSKNTTRRKEVPRDIYLPKAMDAILTRLVDRSRSAGYVFAVYNGLRNDYDMRALTVHKLVSKEIGGQKRACVLFTDQRHYDGETARVYTDMKGRLLQMETDSGFEMVASTRERVRSIFTQNDPDEMIRKLNRPFSGPVRRRR